MRYDFETLVNRKGTGSDKWDLMYQINPDAGDSVPLSVADMEFLNAPEIKTGLADYLEEVILGYTGPTEAYFEAVKGWMKRRHDFNVETEWIVPTSGVVPALFHAVKAYTDPGDGVIIMPPVYYPFNRAILQNGRKIVENPLRRLENGYEIDYEDLEEKAKAPDAKLLILSNPHNPVGRVWKREELERVARICLEHGVFVISDEIHQDLMMPGYRHVSMGTLEDDLASNCVICTAPSKTFNTAGLGTSNIIIRDPKRREAFVKSKESVCGGNGSMMGYKACEIAYNQCEDWLEQLLEYIDGNRKAAEDFFGEHFPTVRVHRMEGTYLLWVDLSPLGYSYQELEEKFQKEAKVFLDEGYIFGKQGEGFERINLACPRRVLMDALERMRKVLA
ncbi:MAG: MalY/PatB family protein [Lachnospiraceae bacterium]